MSPRLLATVIAVPVALLAGALVFSMGMPPSTQPNAAATGPVTVTADPLAERPAAVCGALVDRLPPRVRTADRRPVTAGPKQNAAYGDPAVVLSCGVPAAVFPDTDRVFRLDDVCWHFALAADSTVWTTVDREVPVRVTVPGPQDGASQWVIGFSAAVASTVPSVRSVPSGCLG